jgi:hypothetical protein
MAEYCSKMTEHLSKITERYIKMAYSKHKMTEYRGDGGLGAAVHGTRGMVNVGSAHRSMQDESEARASARVSGEGAGARGRRAHMVSGARGWLAGLGDE